MAEIEKNSKFEDCYELLEELGRGKFGVAHKVRQRLPEEEKGRIAVAKIIKCIKKENRKSVEDEIEIMTALGRHAKLVQLHATFERGRDLILVLEYLSGGELFELVVADDFSLTEWEVIRFIRQICEGVAYMNEKEIAHLDLKPENILCVSPGSHDIKLIDFGFAKKFDPANPPSILFGTPEFVAPEVVNFEPISFETDMWSMGVICYVLLSGFSPFLGDSDSETFTNITKAEVEFDEEEFDAVSQEAKDFISSLLIKNQSKRPSATKCLNSKWLTRSEEEAKNEVVLSTNKLKKFVLRRKWQRTTNAIRAIGRMAHFRKCSAENLLKETAVANGKSIEKITEDVTDLQITSNLEVSKLDDSKLDISNPNCNQEPPMEPQNVANEE